MPSKPLIFIRSPTLNGLSAIIDRDPNKLLRMSFAARAKARPPIPRPARSDVTSYPKCFNMNTKVSPYTSTTEILLIIGTSLSSRSEAVCFVRSRTYLLRITSMNLTIRYEMLTAINMKIRPSTIAEPLIPNVSCFVPNRKPMITTKNTRGLSIISKM